MDFQQSMNCVQCVRKHIAYAISYAKEVIGGHGEGGDPDHRPDMLGELGNAEHHLACIPELQTLYYQLLTVRRDIESNDYVPTGSQLSELRSIWVLVGSQPAVTRQRALPASPNYYNPVPVFKEEPLERIDPPKIEIDRLGVVLLPGEAGGSRDTVLKMLRTFITGPPVEIADGVIPPECSHYVFWPPSLGLVRGWNPILARNIAPGGSQDNKAPLFLDSSQVDIGGAQLDYQGIKALVPVDEPVYAPATAVPPGTKSICCRLKRVFMKSAVLVSWEDGQSLEAVVKYLAENSLEWREAKQ